MRTLSMMLKMIVGFSLACLIAGIVKVGFVNTPADLMALPIEQRMERLGLAGMWALFATNQIAIFALPFAIVAGFYAAWNKVRSATYFVVVGLIIAGFGFTAQLASERPGDATIANPYAVMAYIVAGAAAGWVYWLVAGRNTKRERMPPRRRPAPQLETPTTQTESN
ncbi:MAG: hypothetical protein AAFO75_01535 [Pseudomonadota bacterium]